MQTQRDGDGWLEPNDLICSLRISEHNAVQIIMQKLRSRPSSAQLNLETSHFTCTIYSSSIFDVVHANSSFDSCRIQLRSLFCNYIASLEAFNRIHSCLWLGHWGLKGDWHKKLLEYV